MPGDSVGEPWKLAGRARSSMIRSSMPLRRLSSPAQALSLKPGSSLAWNFGRSVFLDQDWGFTGVNTVQSRPVVAESSTLLVPDAGV